MTRESTSDIFAQLAIDIHDGWTFVARRVGGHRSLTVILALAFIACAFVL